MEEIKELTKQFFSLFGTAYATYVAELSKQDDTSKQTRWESIKWGYLKIFIPFVCFILAMWFCNVQGGLWNTYGTPLFAVLSLVFLVWTYILTFPLIKLYEVIFDKKLDSIEFLKDIIAWVLFLAILLRYYPLSGHYEYVPTVILLLLIIVFVGKMNREKNRAKMEKFAIFFLCLFAFSIIFPGPFFWAKGVFREIRYLGAGPAGKAQKQLEEDLEVQEETKDARKINRANIRIDQDSNVYVVDAKNSAPIRDAEINNMEGLENNFAEQNEGLHSKSNGSNAPETSAIEGLLTFATEKMLFEGSRVIKIGPNEPRYWYKLPRHLGISITEAFDGNYEIYVKKRKEDLPGDPIIGNKRARTELDPNQYQFFSFYCSKEGLLTLSCYRKNP